MDYSLPGNNVLKDHSRPILAAPLKRLPHCFAFFAKGWEAMVPAAPGLIFPTERSE